ncbi:hypothetical protein BV133_3500 [Blastochloris viridis]|uniref:Uncharacterized protein n=1 Tax=Blastochloris viridis TaxID=1079 RepID=A0A182D763_BLAVI|nr:hypothetical protein BV133_3500 [Blastochloris viridis]
MQLIGFLEHRRRSVALRRTATDIGSDRGLLRPLLSPG